MPARTLTRKFVAFMLAGTACLVGVANLCADRLQPTAGEALFVPPARPSVAEREQWALECAEKERAMSGGAHHKPLSIFVEYPGIKQPLLHPVATVDLPDSTPVVGVEVDGEACAFVLDDMKSPEKHIVNMVLNQKAISVAYCDLVDCVRVLSRDSQDPTPLRVGGLDIDQQLVLLLNGERYGQESPELPLDDYPFVRTSWQDWQQSHPHTRVYLIPKD